MEVTDIKALMETFDKSGCSHFEVQQADFSIKLEKQITVVTEPVVQVQPKIEAQEIVKPLAEQSETDKPKTEVETGEVIKAPLVGIFYAAASPEAEAYVQVGSKVEEGQVLCLIEAMKMMSEITATKSGVIKKIYVKNQDVVAFDDPLFVIGD